MFRYVSGPLNGDFSKHIMSAKRWGIPDELKEKGISEENIKTFEVGGSLELPFASKVIAEGNFKPDVIIALGVVIRGETTHYDLVSEVTYQGLMNVQLETGIPIIFGVLTCENLEQVIARISASDQNKGKEFANTALLQIALLNSNK